LRKEGRRRVYELSKDSLKKRLLKTLSAEEAEGPQGREWRVRAETGAKFSPEAFLREGFALPAPEEWVRVSAFARWLPQEAPNAVPRFR
jgi:hypothetical protein